MSSYYGHLLWVGFVNKEQGRYLFVKNIEKVHVCSNLDQYQHTLDPPTIFSTAQTFSQILNFGNAAAIRLFCLGE